MHNGMIKVITGIRRSGKSYLVFKIFNDYLISQGVPENHIIKIELDDRKNKKIHEFKRAIYSWRTCGYKHKKT